MITVVINTRNEEKNIKRAIVSTKNFADEIVVVDMNSTDKTVSIAKELGAIVYQFKETQYVEPARNFAIEKASHEWILVLDADEEITPELGRLLVKVSKSNEADFVRIPRKNMIFGKWIKHSRWWPDLNIRFFKKGAVSWGDEIHSIPITKGRERNIFPHEANSIIHHHYNTIEQYLERSNRYSSIQARELFVKGKEAKLSDFINRPVAEFLSRFFAGEGYKDGKHGLLLSLLQAFSELSVYAKLWQMHNFDDKERFDIKTINQEIAKAQKEINYWKAHVEYIEKHGVGARLKRRFRIT